MTPPLSNWTFLFAMHPTYHHAAPCPQHRSAEFPLSGGNSLTVTSGPEQAPASARSGLRRRTPSRRCGRGCIRLDDPQLAAVQFFDSVGGDLHRRAMAGIVPKNLRAAIQRGIDHAVKVFWNGIRVDRRPA
jgi:transcriptional repressor AefR-like protein